MQEHSVDKTYALNVIFANLTRVISKLEGFYLFWTESVLRSSGISFHILGSGLHF